MIWRQVLMVLWGVSTLARLAQAGEWHVRESLPCGQCHVEHATSGGQPIAGGPYSALLRRGSINELCLSCHDGSDPSAPDVLAPVAMYSQALPPESAGGHFVLSTATHVAGHDLDLATQIPLNSSGKTVALTCGSCHDYHGNTNYRNLRFDPAGKGDSLVIEVGHDVYWNAAPTSPPSATGTAAAYARDNMGYRSGMSAWCSSCHDQVAANLPAAPPAHFNAHPTRAAMGGYSDSRHVDAGHWLAGKGEGFLEDNPISGEGTARLPFLQPGATDFATSRQVLGTNELFCGSCHAAHGTTFTRDLRWPYVEGGVNYLSGCQQCHNK
jgi:hypothetical protein